ncbi:MAG: hypothetical protein ABSG21_05355 [Spirochaetia bacterium]|jgi:hypothetical protein
MLDAIGCRIEWNLVAREQLLTPKRFGASTVQLGGAGCVEKWNCPGFAGECRAKHGAKGRLPRCE